MTKQMMQSVRVFLIASIAACMLALATMLVTTTPAQANLYDLYAYNIKNINCEVYGFYGTPGETVKYTLKADGFDGEDGWGVIRGAKYTYKGDPKLNGSIVGNKLVFKKLPKSGTYTFKIKIVHSDGTWPETLSFRMVVKKTPAVKIKVTEPGKSKALKKVQKGQKVFVNLRGLSFGWNNNTKKDFYVWKVKNLKTGKVAKWNSKKGKFKKNGFIKGESISGNENPIFYGTFTKQGKYKISATFYHNNKKVATKTKTITVK